MERSESRLSVNIAVIWDRTPCSFGTEIRKEEPYDLFITVKDIHIRLQVLPNRDRYQ